MSLHWNALHYFEELIRIYIMHCLTQKEIIILFSACMNIWILKMLLKLSKKNDKPVALKSALKGKSSIPCLKFSLLM